MTTPSLHPTDPSRPPTTYPPTVVRSVAVDVVLPVHNEQRVLAASVCKLHTHIRGLAMSFRITIVDNASEDETLAIARALERALPEVKVLHLERKGRGRALRTAWQRSEADVLAYMDIDLSTELSALAELLGPLLDGTGDVAIGSRLAPGAQVTRGLERETISRSYNLLTRLLLGIRVSDAQCGFKAGRREVIQSLLEEVADEAWFFDTELLYRAQRRRFAIHEMPVRWVEDRDSRVAILATARDDLKGIARLRAERHEQAHLSDSSQLHPSRPADTHTRVAA